MLPPRETDASHYQGGKSEAEGKEGDRRDFAKAYLVEDKASPPEECGQNKKKMDFYW